MLSRVGCTGGSTSRTRPSPVAALPCAHSACPVLRLPPSPLPLACAVGTCGNGLTTGKQSLNHVFNATRRLRGRQFTNKSSFLQYMHNKKVGSPPSHRSQDTFLPARQSNRLKLAEPSVGWLKCGVHCGPTRQGLALQHNQQQGSGTGDLTGCMRHWRSDWVYAALAI